MPTVLGRDDLNRALLARQLLLERQAISAFDAIEHLVGLQAQEPLEPYVGLWSRVQDFQPHELVELLESRRTVRTLLMRRTLHLVTGRDALDLRPVHQQMLETRMLGTLRRRLPGVDLAELAQAGRPLYEDKPHTISEAGRALVERWPDVTARDLGDALSSLVPLVQVPPRGIWGQTALRGTPRSSRGSASRSHPQCHQETLSSCAIWPPMAQRPVLTCALGRG